ncbi:hypothetical protein Lgee_0237 [Legionella geestiana]|uniref:Uncharacterized protein n=1 Tax=Legionella geestiana TaxID=45065 RepID=A0A0W0U8W2_9GAMM|nr:hypothetical protein [Legionella geestiana]KTD04207.1 hypothetical protein Lgee_0237 [Legionella geestiana]QBS11630.1 hypothetical protein E4T54_02125 [Legionella geestiana]STX53688.1 Uncharacterised protein [Legionella geestiana]
MDDARPMDSDTSTYSLITAGQILEKYPLYLNEKARASIPRRPGCVYHLLLQVPLRMLLNGIILQQAHDYQVYVQKLFVDYLLSGESSRDESAPGALTREDLEAERIKVVELSQAFQAFERTHARSMSESQEALTIVARDWREAVEASALRMAPVLKKAGISTTANSVFHGVMDAFAHVEGRLSVQSEEFWDSFGERCGKAIDEPLRKALLPLLPDVTAFIKQVQASATVWDVRAHEQGDEVRRFRKNYYDAILKTGELLALLPEYRKDENRDVENRELLYFDAHLGGDAGAS